MQASAPPGCTVRRKVERPGQLKILAVLKLIIG